MSAAIEETGMKFDVVIGNPPYQEKKEGNDKTDNAVWQKILVKVAKVVKQDGVLAMIHPSGWRGINESYGGSSFLKTKELLHSMDLQYLNINSIEDGKKVFGASTRFDWYVAYNRPYQGLTVVNDENGFETTANLNDYPIIPNDFTVDLNKWIAGADKCEFGYSRSMYGSDKPNMRNAPDEEFKFPCVMNVGVNNQPTKFWWSNENKGMFGVPKVIFGRFGNGVFIDYNGEYGCTQDCAYIAAQVEELEHIREVLQSDEFLKFANATYFGGTGAVFDRKVMALLKKDFWK